ncbi:unnamed protein product [Soboliphyme baturini]|uniref:Uncharacterized protein n=1 Tax=Soboliphyme baturini TaxID=241478 RepID=A0A183IW78_9BILA|nr:unnamed protein product [Soboliphyme baturini]
MEALNSQSGKRVNFSQSVSSVNVAPISSCEEVSYGGHHYPRPKPRKRNSIKKRRSKTVGFVHDFAATSSPQLLCGDNDNNDELTGVNRHLSVSDVSSQNDRYPATANIASMGLRCQSDCTLVSKQGVSKNNDAQAFRRLTTHLPVAASLNGCDRRNEARADPTCSIPTTTGSKTSLSFDDIRWKFEKACAELNQIDEYLDHHEQIRRSQIESQRQSREVRFLRNGVRPSQQARGAVQVVPSSLCRPLTGAVTEPVPVERRLNSKVPIVCPKAVRAVSEHDLRSNRGTPSNTRPSLSTPAYVSLYRKGTHQGADRNNSSTDEEANSSALINWRNKETSCLNKPKPLRECQMFKSKLSVQRVVDSIIKQAETQFSTASVQSLKNKALRECVAKIQGAAPSSSSPTAAVAVTKFQDACTQTSSTSLSRSSSFTWLSEGDLPFYVSSHRDSAVSAKLDFDVVSSSDSTTEVERTVLSESMPSEMCSEFCADGTEQSSSDFSDDEHSSGADVASHFVPSSNTPSTTKFPPAVSSALSQAFRQVDGGYHPAEREDKHNSACANASISNRDAAVTAGGQKQDDQVSSMFSSDNKSSDVASRPRPINGSKSTRPPVINKVAEMAGKCFGKSGVCASAQSPFFKKREGPSPSQTPQLTAKVPSETEIPRLINRKLQLSKSALGLAFRKTAENPSLFSRGSDSGGDLPSFEVGRQNKNFGVSLLHEFPPQLCNKTSKQTNAVDLQPSRYAVSAAFRSSKEDSIAESLPCLTATKTKMKPDESADSEKVSFPSARR